MYHTYWDIHLCVIYPHKHHFRFVRFTGFEPFLTDTIKHYFMWVVLLIYSREEKAMVTEDKVSDTLAT